MITKSDYRYFGKAKQAAAISDFSKIHMGCVAVYQGNIIAIGCNTNKTHPMQKYYDNFYFNSKVLDKKYIPKMHAEINCINSIRNLDINFSKVKLYIYRMRVDKPFSMSRPCPSCMAAIRDLGIKHIYYTTDDGFAYENLSNTTNTK